MHNVHLPLYGIKVQMISNFQTACSFTYKYMRMHGTCISARTNFPGNVPWWIYTTGKCKISTVMAINESSNWWKRSVRQQDNLVRRDVEIPLSRSLYFLHDNQICTKPNECGIRIWHRSEIEPATLGDLRADVPWAFYKHKQSREAPDSELKERRENRDATAGGGDWLEMNREMESADRRGTDDAKPAARVLRCEEASLLHMVVAPRFRIVISGQPLKKLLSVNGAFPLGFFAFPFLNLYAFGGNKGEVSSMIDRCFFSSGPCTASGDRPFARGRSLRTWQNAAHCSSVGIAPFRMLSGK